MYERPTHSVVLPLSKATVILYDFLVKKELDEIADSIPVEKGGE